MHVYEQPVPGGFRYYYLQYNGATVSQWYKYIEQTESSRISVLGFLDALTELAGYYQEAGGPYGEIVGPAGVAMSIVIGGIPSASQGSRYIFSQIQGYASNQTVMVLWRYWYEEYQWIGTKCNLSYRTSITYLYY